MKFANVELLHEGWVSLLEELYSFQGEAAKGTFQLERYCKCMNMDVRLVLRTVIEFEFADNRDFTLTTNTSISTDCVSLRRSNYFWNDKEHVSVTCEIKSTDDRTEIFTRFVTDLVQKIRRFRICRTCRILYQDGRLDNEESKCVHCWYDATFSICDENCVICNYPMHKGDQTFTLTCTHSFHSSCILLSFIKTGKRECPLCRESDNHQL